jgi:hypothetical protein
MSKCEVPLARIFQKPAGCIQGEEFLYKWHFISCTSLKHKENKREEDKVARRSKARIRSIPRIIIEKMIFSGKKNMIMRRRKRHKTK